MPFDQRRQRRRLTEQAPAHHFLDGFFRRCRDVRNAGGAVADELAEQGRVGGPLQPLRHIGIQPFQVHAGSGRVGLDDQEDQRQFLQIDFLDQAQHLLGVGVGPGRQQKQAVGVGRRVAADAFKGALPQDQTEGLLQVGEDGAGKPLVVGDQREAWAGHGRGGPPRGPRPGRRVVPEMAAERIKVVQRVGV